MEFPNLHDLISNVFVLPYHFYFPIIWIYDFQKSSKKVKHPDLVGGIPTPLKNMSSSVGMIIPKMWKNNPFMFQTTNQRFSRILNPDFKALNSSIGPVVPNRARTFGRRTASTAEATALNWPRT